MAENGSTSTSSVRYRTQSSYLFHHTILGLIAFAKFRSGPRKAKTTSGLPSRYTAAVAQYFSFNSLREKRKKEKKKKKKGVK
ncbi:hypothetical protein BELL_0880g00020 [Botrytis elliptica]|uniref:Uncharacterized protein n=1 Tax=Botrytis elliptica TaxID=278938 RepID=A0A4Z1J1Z3_9HELO|nr:hypothetical protein BELL_0880g00020 [Botrytis elliptica]